MGSTRWMGGQRNVDDCQPQADGWAAGKHIGRQASGGASGEHSEEASYYIGDTQAQAVTLSISGWFLWLASYTRWPMVCLGATRDRYSTTCNAHQGQFIDEEH